MVDDSANHSKRRRPGLTTWIVIGLLLGLACGLFFGDYCAALRWVGDAYVGLLQMSVLPYVAVSLVVNVGRLSFAHGRNLLGTGLIVVIGLWAIGLGMMVAMAQAFPDWQTGSFYSSSLVNEPEAHDWMELFIPSNPFRSLNQNAIPAVVIFSIGIGIALIGMPNKANLLDPLDVIVDALAKLNKLVVSLSPVGMFGIVAYTAGTIDFAQFELIQGYLLTYGAAAALLCLFVMPALVAALTPFTMGEVIKVSRNPTIAALIIGNSFVVLPMIIESIKQLYDKRGLKLDAEANSPEYLVPLGYPFPDIGRIVGLVFIPFAAWFYGMTIDPDRYPAIIGVGMLGAFGKPVITIPVLLNIAELPGDIFNLFLASGVIAARFGDAMKCMHLLTFTVLTSCAMAGLLKISWIKLLTGGAVAVLLTAVAVVGIRSYLDATFKDSFSKEQLLTERRLNFKKLREFSNVTFEIRTEKEVAPNPVPINPGETRVQRIKRSGILRIGFDPKKLPFSYYNADEQLVGFDIDMAFFLADDLNSKNVSVNLEFVPIITDELAAEKLFPDLTDLNEQAVLARQLAEDHFDIAMSALEGTVRQAAKLPSIDPYMEVSLAVVVPDHEKNNFRTKAQILAKPDLRLAAVKGSFFAERAPKVFGENRASEIVEPIDSAEEYFSGKYREVDGLLISAEAGAAWTLRYPQFSVMNPLQGRIRVPLYYLTANDPEFEGFIQNWLTLKRNDGTISDLFDYWIQGKESEMKTKRWCVIRDVLKWIE